MLGELTSPDAARQVARHAVKTSAIAREGGRIGLAYTKPTPHRAGYLGSKPASALQTHQVSAQAVEEATKAATEAGTD